jgi:hypothetical protein
MATAIDARNRAATMLGILGEGETLPSYETADFDAAYVEVYARLAAKNVLWWDEDDEIPDECITHVAAMMAMTRADDYGVSNDRYQRVSIRNAVAIPELRELKSNDAEDQDQPDYF